MKPLFFLPVTSKINQRVRYSTHPGWLLAH
nr:MAG TPA: hypothetical protein [Caudoviricetes sp.]